MCFLFLGLLTHIGFDDSFKSQILYAKPILDKYGLKASFFVVCNYVNSGDTRRMNWQDISALQQDRIDLESHTMDHKARASSSRLVLSLIYKYRQDSEKF
jgi:peptidoglycan/xylan/chitin deacetylase (PgdA/CDA1 family)